SLMLYLHPHKVNLERAHDYAAEESPGGPPGRIERIPTTSPGSLGHPSLASSDKGGRTHQHLVHKTRSRISLDPGQRAQAWAAPGPTRVDPGTLPGPAARARNPGIPETERPCE